MQHSALKRHGTRLVAGFALIAGSLGVLPADAQTDTSLVGQITGGSGPIRLQQPQSDLSDRNKVLSARDRTANGAADKSKTQLGHSQSLDNTAELQPGDERTILKNGYRPGEFERYVQKVANSFEIQRYGADLMVDQSALAAEETGSAGRDVADSLGISLVVPADYVVTVGDEVRVSMSGSVDADLRLVVDSGGRIQIPRIGSVRVAGVRYQDLDTTIERQARRVFKNFELSTSLGRLRGVRVLVTGFAEKSGAYSVSSLSTVSSVLFKAGGPAAAGSFRNIELRRRGQVVSQIDLYALMALGGLESDPLVQAGDVIHVGPVGKQVAMIGSVNKPAVFELKPGETIASVLAMAGGFNSVADRSRLAVERLSDRSQQRIRQLAWPTDQAQALDAGDVVRVFSAVAATLPLERQNKRVRVEGEVRHPGDYILPPASSIGDAIRAAGGLTQAADIYGTVFRRESVRLSQTQNYERALRDLELEFSRKSTLAATQTPLPTKASEDGVTLLQLQLQRLRDVKQTGRVVLELQPDAKELPDLALEDGDQLYVPSTPNTVGVFGSVFNAGNFLYQRDRTVGDYLKLAGSGTRNADEDSVFVIRANGSVVSARQQKGAFGTGGARVLAGQRVYPGDTVFVPDVVTTTAFMQNAKDWTQLLYQFALGLLAIRNF
ncbi:MAG: SLBB domain-containing protein [Rubrivivax sp.]|nr:SLBB domain-containing protein [Rubrivivax sp.]